MSFLRELAQLASGSSFNVETNTQLVAEFRRLIWSLRDCWTKRMNLKDGSSSSDSLEGILDLGILTSETLVQSADPKRPLITPAPAARLTWLPGGAAPRTTPRTGKVIDGRPSGYQYLYVDGRQRETEPIGKYFADHKGAEVLVTFDDAAKRDLQGFFVKRVPIRFVPRLAKRPFYRNEPIPLTVELQGDTSLFPPENYVVTATLARNESAQSKGDVPHVTGTLTLNSRSDSTPPTFTAGEDFNALALLGVGEKVGARIEKYNLTIHVEEKPREGAAAESFRWEADLPTQIVEIDNTIPLAEAATVPVLTRGMPEVDASVKTAWPLPDRRLQLRIETSLPRRGDALKPLTGESIRFLSNGLSLNPSAAMQAGVLPIKVALPSDEKTWPEPGPFASGGRITVTCTDPSGLKIATRRVDGVVDAGETDSVSGHRFVAPFGLRLGTIGVRLDALENGLVVGPGKPVGERKIIVSTTDDDAPGVGTKGAGNGTNALKLRLHIEPVDADQLKFDATELSVHAAKEPDRRGSAVDVKERPREGMVVRFQPDPAKHADQRKLVGAHRYRLRAEGVGYNPAE
ncbi:MAG TPA: hypothetical protein PLV92_20160, partial [Pirellulaceae bacterium]|nr:hypothetical protein [Pirellulaceae bacterium]